MGFLSINGFSIPVAIDGMRRPVAEEIGARERMLDGSLRAHRRAKKRRLEFSLPITTESEALEAYEGLLRGDGQVWPFGSGGLYSTKGLGPSAGYDAGLSASGGKYAGRLIIPDAGTITFPTGLPSRWTVSVWRDADGSSGDSHYVVRSDGAKWEDGARDDLLDTSWLSVASGAVTIDSIAAVDADYSDLVVLPFLIPASWVQVLFASTRAFSLLPQLEVYGDALIGSSSSSPVTMVGEVGDSEYQPAKVGGALDKTTQRLSATLREV